MFSYKSRSFHLFSSGHQQPYFLTRPVLHQFFLSSLVVCFLHTVVFFRSLRHLWIILCSHFPISDCIWILCRNMSIFFLFLLNIFFHITLHYYFPPSLTPAFLCLCIVDHTHFKFGGWGFAWISLVISLGKNET